MPVHKLTSQLPYLLYSIKRPTPPPLPTDDDWQEEHARLAELDERVRDGLLEGGDASASARPPPADNATLRSTFPPSSSSSLPPPGLEEKAGGDLAESLTPLILGSDPAIAGVVAAEPDTSMYFHFNLSGILTFPMSSERLNIHIILCLLIN